MSRDAIRDLLIRVRSLGSDARVYTHRGEPTPLPLSCAVEPRASWDRATVEDAVGCQLPEDLVALWEDSGGLRLFEDRQFGQWGLVIWSPSEVVERSALEQAQRPSEHLNGDLIIGEFLGDAERLLVRCAPQVPDFGRLYVVHPTDPRDEWDSPAGSVERFLEFYVDAQGDKFWEDSPS